MDHLRIRQAHRPGARAQAQVAEAQESLHATRNKVRIDVESEIRKINRSDTGLQAARRSVTARTEIVRITNDQVAAKTKL